MKEKNPTNLAKMFQRKIKKFIVRFFCGLTYLQYKYTKIKLK